MIKGINEAIKAIDSYSKDSYQEKAEEIYSAIIKKVPELEHERDNLKIIVENDLMKPDISKLSQELQVKIKEAFPGI